MSKIFFRAGKWTIVYYLSSGWTKYKYNLTLFRGRRAVKTIGFGKFRN